MNKKERDGQVTIILIKFGTKHARRFLWYTLASSLPTARSSKDCKRMNPDAHLPLHRKRSSYFPLFSSLLSVESYKIKIHIVYINIMSIIVNLQDQLLFYSAHWCFVFSENTPQQLIATSRNHHGQKMCHGRETENQSPRRHFPESPCETWVLKMFEACFTLW